jgi:ribosomal protein RSM22 (predicted rRNA methylase)
MTDNELLLAISDMMDKKLKAEFEPIKTKINQIEANQARMNLIIENEIRQDVRTLAENYLPAAQRYEKSTAQIEAMQIDIDVIKKVITEHTEKLQKISYS